MLLGKLVLGGLLLGAAGTDMASRRIPNKLIGVGLAAFLVLAAWLGYARETAVLRGCMMAGALAFAIHLIPYMCKSMGAGDVKLSLVIGLLLGWEDWLGYLQIFCAVSLIVSCIVLIRAKKTKTKALPLAPVMAAAYFIYMCWNSIRFLL